MIFDKRSLLVSIEQCTAVLRHSEPLIGASLENDCTAVIVLCSNSTAVQYKSVNTMCVVQYIEIKQCTAVFRV